MQMRTATSRRRFRRGFTLIEVMIVLAIVLALAGLVGVALFQQRDNAQVSQAQLQLSQIQSGIDVFRLHHNRVPSEEEGIEVLWSSETFREAEEGAGKAWQSSLEKPVPRDPWGNEWGYRVESRQNEDLPYELWSNGPDGEEGTDDDITSWSGGSAGGADGGELLPPPPSR